MTCKHCNTRVPSGLTTCPNCGRGSGASRPRKAQNQDSQSFPLSASNAASKEGTEIDLELEEIAAADPPRGKSARSAKSKAKAGQGLPARKTTKRAAAAGASVTPPADEIRALVAQQPELVESGLRDYEESGKAAGRSFSTPVGEIDLLALDDCGGLVAVMVAERDPGKEIVGELLQRMGWLRKHKASSGQEVRGVILLESMDEELEYAAAAVGETISFKTYRVALTFETVVL